MAAWEQAAAMSRGKIQRGMGAEGNTIAILHFQALVSVCQTDC